MANAIKPFYSIVLPKLIIPTSKITNLKPISRSNSPVLKIPHSPLPSINFLPKIQQIQSYKQETDSNEPLWFIPKPNEKIQTLHDDPYKKIIIIEDNKISSKILEKNLKEIFNHKERSILTFNNYNDALSYISDTNMLSIGLIIMDNNLGSEDYNKNGLNLTKLIRSLPNGYTPLIFDESDEISNDILLIRRKAGFDARIGKNNISIQFLSKFLS